MFDKNFTKKFFSLIFKKSYEISNNKIKIFKSFFIFLKVTSQIVSNKRYTNDISRHDP